jgi:hypothetical protein
VTSLLQIYTVMQCLFASQLLVSFASAFAFEHTQICVPNPNVAPITSSTFQFVLQTYMQIMGQAKAISPGDYGACCSGFCMHLSRGTMYLTGSERDSEFVIAPEALADAVEELRDCVGNSAEAMTAMFGTQPQSKPIIGEGLTKIGPKNEGRAMIGFHPDDGRWDFPRCFV